MNKTNMAWPSSTLRNIARMIALFIALSTACGANAIEPAIPVDSPAWKGSGALFIGVGEFTNPDSGLASLRYTVEDAVTMANLMTRELKLIPAQNVWLALSGIPT